MLSFSKQIFTIKKTNAKSKSFTNTKISKSNEIKKERIIIINKRTFVDLTNQRTTTGSAVVTIFGSSGFTGRFISSALVRNGAQLILPYRGKDYEVNHMKPMGEVGQVIAFPFSPHDQNSIDIAVSKSNVVINLIGSRSETKRYGFHDINVVTAERVALAAKKANCVRFIHLSAIGADVNSESGFLASKAESEKVVKSILPHANIIRCAPMFGLRDKFLNPFGRAAQLGKNFFLSPVRLQTRVQPLFAGDMALGVLNIVMDDSLRGIDFEFAGPEIMTIRQLIRDIIYPETMREDVPIYQIPEFIAKPLCKVWGIGRRPTWTADDPAYYKEDKVATGDFGQSLQDLNVTELSKVIDHSTNVLRIFRPPNRANL